MQIITGTDIAYGYYEIDSPVIVEMINSKSIQRLIKLNQFGIPDEFHVLKNFSRYDHSVGVMLLLQKLGAGEEEQIAGVLHDVSHRAFSHVYDWVVGQIDTKDSQDQGHDDFLRNSEIPVILEKYGYQIDRISEPKNYGLLDRDSPDLCADRLDYLFKEMESGLVLELVGGLTVFENQVVCVDIDTAARLGREFINLQMNHFGGYEEMARWQILSQILKVALKKNIITPEDFWKTDNFIIDILNKCGDIEITKLLEFLRQKPLPRVTEGEVVVKKFRYIDPPIKTESGLKKLTEIDGEYKRLLDEAREKTSRGVLLPRIENLV